MIPHVLMFSFTGQGHLNPLLRLAKRIAAKGLKITFSTNAETGRKIVTSTAITPGIDHPIGRGFIRFEFLPDDVTFEDVDTSPANLARLCEIGPKLVANMIENMANEGRPVSCLINNPFVPWVLDVAADLNIPAAVLWVQSSAVFSIYYHYYHSLVEFPSNDRPDLAVSLPGLPELKIDDVPGFLLNDIYVSLRDIILTQFGNISKASWVFVNSFEALEDDAIKSMSEKVQLIPVGPLIEPNDESVMSVRGDMFKAEDCMAWLDEQEPHSVVYVALGSLVVLSRDEVVEMAAGLQSCGQPFLWVVRSDSRQLLPDGFISDVKDKGLVVSWSHQEQVLAHKSIACFLTHCGWNSTLEALAFGTPVITFPQFGDHMTDSKFLVDVYGVGVRLKSPVTRINLQQCVEALTMGPEAEEIRRRAMEWSDKARSAVAEGGPSAQNIQAFVDEICRRVSEGQEFES